MRYLYPVLLIATFAANAGSAEAQTRPSDRPLQVEWVYRVKYGFQDEWWRLFKKYQLATLAREKQLGYVTDYQVFRPGAHTSEDSRWDYRIIITYPNYDGSKREGDVEAQLFPDKAALAREENRRWELTLNHWDLPIRQIDPGSEPD